MSFLNDVQKFIEVYLGCIFGDIVDVFVGYLWQCVLQLVSKLRQSGCVVYCCEGDIYRYFLCLIERVQDLEL